MSRLLRRDELCPGSEVCPEAYAAPDLPCEECPRERLDACVQFTSAGQLVSAALDLDWATNCGLHVTLSDVTYTEFVCLRILEEERERYRKEQQDRERMQQDIERRRHGR